MHDPVDACSRRVTCHQWRASAAKTVATSTLRHNEVQPLDFRWEVALTHSTRARNIGSMPRLWGLIRC